MSDETKQTTPDDAMQAALPGVSPAAVLEIMEDPTVAQPMARAQWLVEFDRMRRLTQNPNFPINQRMEWMRMLEKIGGVTAPDIAQASGPAFSISINIPQIGATPAKTLTLEANQPALSATDE